MDACLRKYIAEFLGTMVLVLVGCGVAVITGGNIVPTALAFGLAIVAMAYAIGNISGCHINPAVTIAQLINKKIDAKQAVGYIIFQFIGAIVGAVLLYAILSQIPGYDLGLRGLGCNFFGEHGGIDVGGAFLVETILTMIFVLLILGVLADKKMSGQEGIIIGLTLTFLHLFGIALTGTSVNPARSFGPALISCIDNTIALEQVWLFIIAPIVGAIIAAFLFKYIFNPEDAE